MVSLTLLAFREQHTQERSCSGMLSFSVIYLLHSPISLSGKDSALAGLSVSASLLKAQNCWFSVGHVFTRNEDPEIITAICGSTTQLQSVRPKAHTFSALLLQERECVPHEPLYFLPTSWDKPRGRVILVPVPPHIRADSQGWSGPRRGSPGNLHLHGTTCFSRSHETATSVSLQLQTVWFLL